MAALRVIHQAGYVTDSYRNKRPEPPGLAGFSRGIDYGLLAASLFVLATFKFTGAALRIFGIDLSQHPFTTGGRQLLFPAVLREEGFAWLALTAFVLCTAAFLIKCGYEIAGRRLNVPKTLHMSLAAGLFFITPALQNLDVAFQGLNTWHSFQYLAVVIFLNRLRQARGTIGSATVARFASRGWGMYAVGIGLTAACGVLYLALRGLVLLLDAWPGDPMQQHYFCFYVAVLSALLIHYYFDHFLFLRIDGIITPRARGSEPARCYRVGGDDRSLIRLTPSDDDATLQERLSSFLSEMNLDPLRGYDGYNLVTIRHRCFLAVAMWIASDRAPGPRGSTWMP